MAVEGSHPSVEEDLSRVLGHFGLGGLLDSRQIERGFVDENWAVDTDQGLFFVKRRHPHRSKSHDLIRAQHELMGWLRLQGFPVPAIVPTTVGETFLVLDRDLYEVLEFVSGKPYDRDRQEHLLEAGRTLGWYHSLVEGFSSTILAERDVLYCPANSAAVLAGLQDHWALADEPDLLWVARQLEIQVENLAVRFSQHGDLPRLIIHGDYYAGNLLFDGDNIVGVVDYDKANWQPRVSEVAEALIYFASPRPGHLKHLVYPGFLDWEPFARLLKGYARATTLASAEIGALPDYIRCIWLSMSIQRLLERDPVRPGHALQALQEVLTLATWASANARQMVEIAHAAMEARNGEDLRDPSDYI